MNLVCKISMEMRFAVKNKTGGEQNCPVQ